MTLLKQTRKNAIGRLRAFETQAKANIPGIRRISADPSVIINQGYTDLNQKASYAHFKNWVYVAVNAIAKRLSGQCVFVGEMRDASPNPQRMMSLRKTWGDNVPDRIRQKAALHEIDVIKDHPALDLITKPNPIQRKYEFIYLSAANLLITGESYWIGGAYQDQIEMWAIPTSWIRPLHENGLFTGYIFKPPGNEEGIRLSPEQVARTYLPDPSDLKCAYSPLHAIIGASTTDTYLQDTQEEMFARGVHPNLMITIGRSVGPDGRLTDRKPVLTGWQRRQLIKSVREIWGNTVNRGDPAIIDGLIESVHKLQATPQEMDFLKSGEVVKQRVLQAYAINPIVLGELQGGNRAQAIEADKQFTVQAVNPVGGAFSETMTDFIGPLYDRPSRLLMWIDPAEPHDPELERKVWTDARKQGDVSRNEYRTHVLKLQPIEEIVERNQLLSGTGGMQETVKVLMALGKREITREQAKRLLMLFLEIDDAVAEELLGDEIAELPPVLLPPDDDDMEEDEDMEEEEEEEEEEEGALAASVDVQLTKIRESLTGILQGTNDAVLDMISHRPFIGD